MAEETTTEQLVEIEEQAAEYTPPEGWRVLQVGEVLRDGDLWVNHEGELWPTKRVGETVNDERYIRRIEPEPQPQPETQPQPQPVQVREGRWRTRGGEVKYIRAGGSRRDTHYSWPWTDGLMCFQDNGFYQASKPCDDDLVEYLGPIEPQPQPQQNGLVRDVTHLLQESGVLDLAKAEEQIEELRSEVHYVQRLLGESRQRVTQLEELVGSLRTINEATEKTVRAAGRENADLQHRLEVVSDQWAEQADTARKLQTQLEAVKAELVTQAETSRRLQIELDAAQQVPADSPELRQLWANLAEVAHDRDTYKHAHELLVQDIDATHQRTKAETVEAIAAWLEPIRREDPHLRAVILFHLPKIIRSLAGLNTPEDVD